MKAEERCRTCRYWQPFEIEEEDDGGYRAVYTAGDDESRRSISPEQAAEARWGVCNWQGAEGSLFYTQDASNYDSWLMTQDEFGCVQWAPHP